MWGRKPEEKTKTRRCKLMFMGKPGTCKTLLALEWPRAAYIDNHKSASPYEPSFPEHRFDNPKSADETANSIISLAKNPGDRLTSVLDDVSVYNTQIRDKWHDLFLTRLGGGKGHHEEFYTNQPGDWEHPKRELKRYINMLINMDMNLILIARSANEYAGSSSANFMKVIGTTFEGDSSLGYAPDYVFELFETNGKRYCEVHKQRINIKAGEKLFPQTFEFEVGGFYKFFLEHVNQDLLMKKAVPMSDEELIVEEDLSESPSKETVSESTEASTEKKKTNGFINKDQLQACKRLKGELKLTNEKWFERVGNKVPKARSVKDFTYDQAEEFISELTQLKYTPEFMELFNRPTQSQESSKS